MKIRNVLGRPLEIAATGQLVGPDEVVEVDDTLGRALCEQPANWKPATTRKASKNDDVPEEGDR